jgi:hypothetical protein
MMTEQAKIIILVLILMIIGVLAWSYSVLPEKPVACTADAKLCSDGSYVSRTGPNCEFTPCAKEDLIRVSLPRANEVVSSPLLITGEARGNWFFEASFPIRLYDAEGKELGVAVAQAKSDWMTEDFVPFEAKLAFQAPKTANGTLVFEKDNPSGLPENADELRMPVLFSSVQGDMRNVKLYYYNQEKDKDATGNVKCSRDGLAAIEREIPVTKTPIQDTINLLLRGKENLTAVDEAQGISTEYPLEGFSLVEANLKADGTLILKFNDSLNKTSGGSCRVGILWFQIEAAAKQFSGVKKVQFLPEELFQP